MPGLTLTDLLARGSLVVSAANLIIGFSLLGYIVSHNFRSGLARAFVALLTFLVLVHGGDILLLNAKPEGRLLWLRLQWVGVALLPAAYFHLSDAVLRSTHHASEWRRAAVRTAYLAGLLFVGLAVGTDLLMRAGTVTPWAAYFRAGPLFGFFLLYFALSSLGGLVNILRARSRTLTRTARRRITYLAVSSVAPPLGVFPYLTVAEASAVLSENPDFLLFLHSVGDVWLALMTIVMAYSVAFHGVLLPDRVVKLSLSEFLVRGPLVGAVVLLLMLTVPQAETLLGLSTGTALIFAVVGAMVVLQLVFHVGQPYVAALLFPRDRRELGLIHRLEERLLTSTDLEQLLENVLVGLSELLRSEGGLVAGVEEGELRVVATTWPRSRAEARLGELEMAHLLGGFEEERPILAGDGHWVLPLRNRRRDATLGVMVLPGRSPQPDLSPAEAGSLDALVSRAEVALENRQLQRSVFSVLQQIIPEMDSLQRFRSTPQYAGVALESLEASPVYQRDFDQWVKEALSHYWGGPKLAQSPLLQLNVVRRTAQANGGDLPPALRTVLQEAIQRLRPEGEPSLESSAWVLYNILEMKFLRGRKIRQIARRLSISESDFYRKQRLAVGAVARQLVLMEQEA